MDIIDKIIDEEIDKFLAEAGRCQKGYKTHKKRKTKKMYGKTYRNCVKAESEGQLAEAQPTSAHNIVRRMMKTGDDALTTLMSLLNDPQISREEASNWLKRNTQDINRAKRELGYRPGGPPFEEGKSIHTAVKLRIAEVDGLDEKKKKRKKRKGGKRDGKGASSKGYSLRDWFKGGGWVQTGGKYDGKPCAKQPGQKTKPYCRDPDDRAKLSKKDRDKRARKKRKEDPNPNRRGKAKNVTQKKKGKKK